MSSSVKSSLIALDCPASAQGLNAFTVWLFKLCTRQTQRSRGQDICYTVLLIQPWLVTSNTNTKFVNFVARHGVYFRRMLAPIGQNSLFCCRRYGVQLSDIADINKSFVWSYYKSQLTVSYCITVQVLLELQFVNLDIFQSRVYLRLTSPTLLTSFVPPD